MSRETIDKSQNFLDKIINSIDDPILVTDENYRLILFNKAFCNFIGYDLSELLYKTVYDILPAEEANVFWGKSKEVLLTGREDIAEDEVTDAFGAIHTIVTKKTPYVDTRGKKHIICIIRDVTEQNRAEDIIRRSEKKFRALAQTAVDAIILADERGNTIFWNKGAERMFGFTEEQMLGRPITDCIPEAYKEKHRRGLERAGPDGIGSLTGHTIELTAQNSKGEKFPIELSLNTWGTQGERFFSGIARSISHRKKAEKALKESEERFRQLAETIKEVFWLTSAETFEPIYISPAYETVWGRSCENLYEKPESWIESIHPEDRDRVRKAWKKLKAKGRFDEEYRIIRPDGEVRWIRDRAFQVEDEAGKVYRFAGIARDITERKKLEHQLREASLRDELTGLYNRRGFLTLAEQQLKVSNRKGRATTLSFVDLDGMKSINDYFGHQAGDQALLDTANILNKTFRESDIIARIGGDEFAVMSGEAGAEDSVALQERLQRNLEEYRQESEAKYRLELSMGTVDYEPGSHLSLEQLLNKADERMYEQKMTKRR
ncbi:MAG TPA: PAS domain S-box protein [Desulfuromonadales bacterium]|nr:PAS domain S-box protein [Desulfuromonadales bacterium]